MVLVNLQKTLEIFFLLGSTLHREKIDDLNEQQRLPLTRFPHSLDQLAQPIYKPIVTNAKQRSTRNVAHASRLDHEHTRTAFREPSIPVEILLSDKSILRGAPRHHRRHPRAAPSFETTDGNRTIKSRPGCFFRRRPASLEYLVFDWVSELPHFLQQITRITRITVIC